MRAIAALLPLTIGVFAGCSEYDLSPKDDGNVESGPQIQVADPDWPAG